MWFSGPDFLNIFQFVDACALATYSCEQPSSVVAKAISNRGQLLMPRPHTDANGGAKC